MTNLVPLTVGGRPAMVPADKVSLLVKKEQLVARAIALGGAFAKDPSPELIKTAASIRRLNRRIGPCVQIIR